jgi:DNA-binding winged helix-turn-helix (wHTH) protein/Tfp pilus assembly protein PilF
MGNNMDHPAPEFYKFGPFVLQPSERRLLREGNAVSLRPKSFDLLVLLVREHGRLLTKDELLNRLWPNLSIQEDNVPATVWEVRKALGETVSERYIETIPKQGYRFVALVESGAQKPPEPEKPPGPGEPETPVVGMPVEPGSLSFHGLTWMGVAIVLAVVGGISLWLTRRPAKQAFFDEAIKYEREGDDELAVKSLDQAIAENQNRAEAYLKAAFILNQLDETDRASEYLKHAEAVAEQQSADYKWKCDGLRKLLDNLPDEANTQFRLASDNYPHDTDAHAALVDVALNLNREAEAELGLQRCLEVDPDHAFCQYQAMRLDLQRNGFDAVLARAHKLTDRGLAYPYWESQVGLAYLAKDDFSNADEHFKNLLDASNRYHGKALVLAARDSLADSAVYRGHIKDSVRLLQGARDSAASKEEKADYEVTLARQFADLGGVASSKSVLETALKDAESLEIRSRAAIVAGIIGDRALAERANSKDDLDPSVRQTVNGLLSLAEGEIPIAINDLKASYDNAPKPDIAYWLGIANMKAHDWSKAAEYFDKVISSKGKILDDDDSTILYWVLAHYQQAICYQQSQFLKPAIERYQQFLSLWKEADPDLKQRADAQQQLHMLSTN